MPGPQGEYAAVASPVKKSKLSLKFLQKKEAKRALDFSEPLADEPKTVKHVEPEARCVSAVIVVLFLVIQSSKHWYNQTFCWGMTCVVMLSVGPCQIHASQSFNTITSHCLIISKIYVDKDIFYIDIWVEIQPWLMSAAPVQLQGWNK